MENNNPYVEYDNRMVTEETNSAMISYRNEQTTEQPTINNPIMTTNTNNPKTEQLSDVDYQKIIESAQNAIKTLALSKGSRILNTLTTIKSLISEHEFEARSKTFNLSKTICKRLNMDPADDAEFFATLIWETIDALIMSITDAKPTKTTSRAGGVLHSETVTYAVRLINGGLLRSSRVASALERVALRMCAGDFDINDMPVSLDKELNKAYAAIRSQATKNGEELGGKSNTVTKEATKEAIVKAIRIMKETDSYEYDILIGNLPEQPKHLKE